MAIDDNSWDAGYETGIAAQRKADAAQILALEQQVSMLQALLASRCKVASDEDSEKARREALLSGPGISI